MESHLDLSVQFRSDASHALATIEKVQSEAGLYLDRLLLELRRNFGLQITGQHVDSLIDNGEHVRLRFDNEYKWLLTRDFRKTQNIAIDPFQLVYKPGTVWLLRYTIICKIDGTSAPLGVDRSARFKLEGLLVAYVMWLWKEPIKHAPLTGGDKVI